MSENDESEEKPRRVQRVAARVQRAAEEASRGDDGSLDLKKSLTWLIPFAMLVVAIVAVPLRILADEGLPRYRALQAEQVDLDAQNDRLRREVRALQRDVEALRSDPGAIERIARDELGMVRPGEVIFQFSE